LKNKGKSESRQLIDPGVRSFILCFIAASADANTLPAVPDKTSPTDGLLPAGYASGYQSGAVEPNVSEKHEKALFRKQQGEHNEAMEKSKSKRYKDELPLYQGAEKGMKEKASALQNKLTSQMVSIKLKSEYYQKLTAKAAEEKQALARRQEKVASLKDGAATDAVDVVQTKKKLMQDTKLTERRDRAVQEAKQNLQKAKLLVRKGATTEAQKKTAQLEMSTDRTQEMKAKSQVTVAELAANKAKKQVDKLKPGKNGFKDAVKMQAALVTDVKKAAARAASFELKMASNEKRIGQLSLELGEQAGAREQVAAAKQELDYRKQRVKSMQKKLGHENRKAKREEGRLAGAQDKTSTGKDVRLQALERIKQTEKQAATTAAEVEVEKMRLEEIKKDAKKALKDAKVADEQASAAEYRTVTANPDEYKQASLTAIERARRLAKQADERVEKAKTAVNAHQGMDKGANTKLSDALKNRKIAAMKALAAVDGAKKAKTASKKTASSAANAIQTAHAAAMEAKKALEKLFDVANDKAPAAKKAVKPDAAAMKREAQKWAIVEKKAAENAMKAIAANIKAVKAEKSERGLASTAVREATNAAKNYDNVIKNNADVKERYSKAKYRASLAKSRVQDMKEQVDAAQSEASATKQASSLEQKSRKVVSEGQREVNGLVVKRNMARSQVTRATTSGNAAAATAAQSKVDEISMELEKARMKVMKATSDLGSAVRDKVRGKAARKKYQLMKRSLERRQEDASEATKNMQKLAANENSAASKVATAKAAKEDGMIAADRARAQADAVHAALLKGAAMSAVKLAAKAAKAEMSAIAKEKTDGSPDAIFRAKAAVLKAKAAVATVRVDMKMAKAGEFEAGKAKEVAEKAKAAVIKKADAALAKKNKDHSEEDYRIAVAQKKAAIELSQKAIQRTIDAAAATTNSPAYIKGASEAMKKATRQVERANAAASTAALVKEKAEKTANADVKRAKAVMQQARAAAEAAKAEMIQANKAVAVAHKAGMSMKSARKNQHDAASAVAKAEHESIAAAAVVNAVSMTEDKLSQLKQKQKTIAKNGKADANAAQASLSDMAAEMRTSLQVQMANRRKQKKAKHQVDVTKLDVELAREKYQAKVIMVKTSSEQFVTAKAGLDAVAKDNKQKKNELKAKLQESLLNIPNGTNATMMAARKKLKDNFLKNTIEQEKTSNEKIQAMADKVQKTAAQKIFTEQQALEGKMTLLHQARKLENANEELNKENNFLSASRDNFQKMAAHMIAKATQAAQEKTENAADEAAAVARAQALGKQAVEKLVSAVESQSSAKQDFDNAEQAKEKEVKARAAWVIASGMATKAQEQMKTMQAEEKVTLAGSSTGTQSITKHKVSGAVYAAQGTLLTAQKMMLEYNEAKDNYARKAAIADAATAVDETNQISLDTILPKHGGQTKELKLSAKTTLDQLRKLYGAAHKGLLSDQRYLSTVNNRTANLVNELGEARHDEARAAYEHKYAARLHEKLVNAKLLHLQKRRSTMEIKVKRDAEEAKTYRLDEMAAEHKYQAALHDKLEHAPLKKLFQPKTIKPAATASRAPKTPDALSSLKAKILASMGLDKASQEGTKTVAVPEPLSLVAAHGFGDLANFKDRLLKEVYSGTEVAPKAPVDTSPKADPNAILAAMKARILGDETERDDTSVEHTRDTTLDIAPALNGDEAHTSQ